MKTTSQWNSKLKGLTKMQQFFLISKMETILQNLEVFLFLNLKGFFCDGSEDAFEDNPEEVCHTLFFPSPSIISLHYYAAAYYVQNL